MRAKLKFATDLSGVLNIFRQMNDSIDICSRSFAIELYKLDPPHERYRST